MAPEKAWRDKQADSDGCGCVEEAAALVGAYAELEESGECGPATLALLRRLGAQVVATSSFPPPDGHRRWTDVPLDDVGLGEAWRLAPVVASLAPRLIVTGDLVRASVPRRLRPQVVTWRVRVRPSSWSPTATRSPRWSGCCSPYRSHDGPSTTSATAWGSGSGGGRTTRWRSVGRVSPPGSGEPS